MADILVFVPAWNEEGSLPAVLAELAAELPDADVLVVDDGSTDATASLARDAGAQVLSFGENRGLKAAIAGGYSYALETRTASTRSPSCGGCSTWFARAPATSPSAPASSPARATRSTATGRAGRDGSARPRSGG